MKIAVFSDSHDRMDLIERALEMVKERGITEALHLGDFCAPLALELLAKSGMHWQCVWGNVDGDKLKAYRQIEQYKNFDIVDGDFREITLDGHQIFLTHYPEIARLAALSGKFYAVFHGHNHVAASEMINDTLLANPGELCGFRYGTPTFGIYDTDSNTIEHLTI